MKRLVDVVLSAIGILLSSPLLTLSVLAVYLQDFKSPFYIAERIGRGGKPFRMIKIRSMVVNADKSGVASTSGDDRRITAIGHLIRKFKLDELAQLYNVLIGDMSLVGPRPNVKVETDLYSDEERKLLSVRPGITDFSSIVFSDEGEILRGKEDPDLAYNQLIRPGKGYLGLVYVENQSFYLDIRLIIITIIAIFSRRVALGFSSRILERLAVPTFILEIARREVDLKPLPPPGLDRVVSRR